MNNDAISRSDLWTDIMMIPHNGDIIFSSEVEEAIKNAPALDVAPVVRCKDCCYNSGLASGDGWCKDDIVCSYHMSDGFEDNDFCSRGKRYEAD